MIFHHSSRTWGCDIAKIQHPFKDRTELPRSKGEKSYELLLRSNKSDVA
jgi:hypothetical protein